MSISVKDGGTWKEAEMYVRDAGTWKLVEGSVRDAGTWKGFTSRAAEIGLVAHTMTYLSVYIKSPVTATSTLHIQSGGNAVSNGVGSPTISPSISTTTEWLVDGFTPADWEVKCTATTGSFSSGSGTGTWLRCNANRSWTVTYTGTSGSKSCTFTLDFGLYGTSTSLVTITGLIVKADVV